ncbi:MAG: proline rich protein, partial [Rhizobacter sp.]|nr:proline rich protein [Rhizobacter sp.]
MADSFLSRWSQRKVAVKTGLAVPPEPVVERRDAVVVAGDDAHVARDAAPAADVADTAAALEAHSPEPTEPAPTLDDVALLTQDSDFSRFVAKGVDETVKRAAMKKLFSDPHFNVMDRLDTYIDDYGIPDPLPPGMLEQLNQADAMMLPGTPSYLAREAALAEEAQAQAQAQAVVSSIASDDVAVDASPPPDSIDRPVAIAETGNGNGTEANSAPALSTAPTSASAPLTTPAS